MKATKRENFVQIKVFLTIILCVKMSCSTTVTRPLKDGLVVPEVYVEGLVTNCRFWHVGPKKYTGATRDVCNFPALYKRVRRIIRSCDLCRRTKCPGRRLPLRTTPVRAEQRPIHFRRSQLFHEIRTNVPYEKATATPVTNRTGQWLHKYPRDTENRRTDIGAQFTSKAWHTRYFRNHYRRISSSEQPSRTCDGTSTWATIQNLLACLSYRVATVCAIYRMDI